MKERYRKARAALYGFLYFLLFSVAAQVGSPVGAYEPELPVPAESVSALQNQR